MERLVPELRAALAARPGRPLHLPGLLLKESAVLVPLFERAGEPHLLFTRRPGHLRQHAGQISFPGGSRDADDATPLHTALREAEEEIGLSRSSVDVLGSLDEIPTITEFRVSPFVGLLPKEPRWRPNPDEVAELIEVPVRHLFRPGTARVEHAFVFGQEHEVHFFDYGAHVIWGATGRVVRNLLDVAGALPAWKEWLES